MFTPRRESQRSRQRGVITYNIYDGWDAILRYNESGAETGNLIHGGSTDEIVCRNSFTASYYYQYDGLGSTSHVFDPSGNLLESYEYDAYGSVTIQSPAGNVLSASAIGNRYLFTGREYLSQLNLYDYRNRIYSPEQGRFLEPDPTGFDAGDDNLYRYCGNNPMNECDPTGLDAVRLGNGKFKYFVSPGLNSRALVGRDHVGNFNPRYDGQCATGAQLLAGTTRGGIRYDAPKTATWTKGSPVNSKVQVGTMVAKGWSGNSYPNQDADSKYYKPGGAGYGQPINHTGVVSSVDSDGTVYVQSQSVGKQMSIDSIGTGSG